MAIFRKKEIRNSESDLHSPSDDFNQCRREMKKPGLDNACVSVIPSI